MLNPNILIPHAPDEARFSSVERFSHIMISMLCWIDRGGHSAPGG
jgi:hypothetical protein